MLEQAVIDAQALKEAAIKNAEQEVLDKYAGEIKEAVDVLLEQEDPMADPMAVDPMADPMAMDPMAAAEESPSDPALDKIPLKATENLRDEGDDGVHIELDLDALKSELSSSPGVSEMEMPLEEPPPEMMYETTRSELKELLEENEEDIELDEETIKAAIEEILKVDLENVPRGMLGTTHPTKQEQVRAVEVAAARDEDTDVKEDNAGFEKAARKIANLEEQVKSLKSDKNRLVKEHNELKSIARQVSEKLTEINTANAKLVYQNRILKSHSLNERQKQKLVEAVSNATSSKEAKVIFDTLQDSLSNKGDNSPKNLSEAVSKNSRLVLKSNKEESQASSSAVERMRKLAGII
jgi:hemerythrin-like domain-containing protein